MNFETIVNIAKQVGETAGELPEIQELTGGMIWNSGGGCMILSILLQDSIVDVSDEFIREYTSRGGFVLLSDLIDMDEEEIECLNVVER